MPVTAKLSKAFYQQLGHEVTDELVDYLNDIDAAYRTDLRDLNELNFARFDAKLEQRVAGLAAKIDQLAAVFEAKLDQLAAVFEAKLEQRTAELRTELQVGLAAVRSEISQSHSSLLRWNFVFWAAAIGAIVGLR